MISTDREILIAINDEVIAIRQEVKSLNDRVTRLEGLTATIVHEQDIMKNDIASLQTSVYWGFAIVSLVIALPGVFVPALLTRKSDPPAAPPVLHVYTYPVTPTQPPKAAVQEPEEARA